MAGEGAAGGGEGVVDSDGSVDDGAVFIGESVVKNGGSEIDSLTATGGTVVCEADTNDLYLKSGTPTVTYRGGNVDDLKAYAGSLNWDTNATITDAWFGACVVDFDAGFGAVTITNAYMYSGFSVTDSKRRVTWSHGWDYLGCGRESGSLDFGPDYTETPSAL